MKIPFFLISDFNTRSFLFIAQTGFGMTDAVVNVSQ